MNDAMENFILILTLINFSHFFLLIYANKNRIRKLVVFLEDFRRDNLLTEKDYERLHDQYTGFLSYLEFFPDKDDYKALYENNDFDKFVTKTRRKLKYYAIISAVTFALLCTLLSIFPTDKPI